MLTSGWCLLVILPLSCDISLKCPFINPHHMFCVVWTICTSCAFSPKLDQIHCELLRIGVLGIFVKTTFAHINLMDILDQSSPCCGAETNKPNIH